MSPLTWQRLRKATQILALLLFIYLFIQSIYLGQLSALNGIYYRLDPLVSFSAMLAGRLFIPALALSLLTIVFSLIFGRAWCGWICPLGTILEWTSPHKKRSKLNGPAPDPGWRKVKYLLALAILVMAFLGNQTFIFLDPITILTRTGATTIWPAFRYSVFSIENFLYQFKGLWPFLDFVHNTVVVPLFHNIQSVFTTGLLVFIFFIGIIALNWIAERSWCRYICPLGGILGWISRVSLLRREVKPNCTKCGLCDLVCPTGTIDPLKEYHSDPAECINCMDCLVACKFESNAFIWQLPKWTKAEKQSYDPSRREALATLALAVGGVAVAGIEPITRRSPARLIRPPGTTLTDFSSLCIRCGECVRNCPTQGLQPSGLEGGWQNFMTPHLVPRLGYCAYDCRACTQGCPSGAIPSLSLDEKRVVPIGLASINKDRCLPWSYNTPCIVCEEMCPLPDKAIKIQQDVGSDLQKPYVLKEKCIGCGVCEFHCPVGGDAAIQVFSLPDNNHPLSNL